MIVRFWMCLAGFAASLVLMVWMIALSLFVTVGDSLGNIFTLGAVQDGLSGDPVGGFVQQNTGALVLVSAIMALGFLYLTVTSRQKDDRRDQSD